ncbi:hypothetical protein I8920_09440 [Curtobacterium sp. YC1]|uniref:hypothetical protein n=1 Tax=Curtobacterium sp. YC1 TaxID=2795488 RepID=UPI0018E53D98|nr:hypothetical protein [Curtobacterium sp. YC1]QQD75091.1 hypothetical protein I8920_09440 [Curtobacterium sp. YC1]
MRGDVAPGDLVHGFRVTRSERPLYGTKRGVWVECPSCGKEFKSMPSNLRRVKGCGCKQGKNKFPNKYPIGTKLGEFVVMSGRRESVPYSAALTVRVRCPWCKQPWDALPVSIRKARSCGCARGKLRRYDRLTAEFSKALAMDFRYAERMAREANDLINGTGVYKSKRNQVE